MLRIHAYALPPTVNVRLFVCENVGNETYVIGLFEIDRGLAGSRNFWL